MYQKNTVHERAVLQVKAFILWVVVVVVPKGG